MIAALEQGKILIGVAHMPEHSMQMLVRFLTHKGSIAWIAITCLRQHGA